MENECLLLLKINAIETKLCYSIPSRNSCPPESLSLRPALGLIKRKMNGVRLALVSQHTLLRPFLEVIGTAEKGVSFLHV